MKNLSKHQEKVVSAFDKKDEDITISLIYMRVYGHAEWQRAGTKRNMQQKLAPAFRDINEKITPARIIPGFLKGTYRYSTGE